MNEVQVEHTESIAVLEDNYFDMYRLMGEPQGCVIRDTPAYLSVATPLSVAPFNAVLRFHGGERDVAERDLDEALGVFQGLNVPPVFVVHPTASPSDIRSRLSSRGFAQAENTSGMIKHLERDETVGPNLPPGIEIVNGNELEWIDLVSWRYGIPKDSAGYLAQLYELGVAQGDRFWVARQNGVAVSKAELHVHGGVAGIYGVVTLDASRGMHLAAAVTLAAMTHAFELGVRTVVLHSTPMAASLYRRLGFSPVADFEVWAEPDSLFRSVAIGLRAERKRQREARQANEPV